jgi:hypothetical protein
LKILEKSQIGCLWLRSNWEELKSRLEDPPNNFQAIDRFTSIRLLGRQPVECMEHYSVAEIFVASHVIRPVGKSAFEDLLSDMTTSQHDVFLKEIGRRWPELKSIREPANAREILIDLCESNIEELNEKLAEYKENAEAIAEAKFNNLGLDETPEGRSVRLYLLKCHSAYSRADELLKKHQGKKKTEAERGYHEPRRIEDESRWPMDRARPTPPVARPAMPVADDDVDIVWAKETYPCDQVPNAAPPPLPTGEAEAEGLRLPSAEAMEEPRDEMTQQSEKIENVKNEPKFDEGPVIAKTQIIVGVTANSGVKSGLDSFGSFSDFSGQLPLGDAARSRDENRSGRGEAATEEDASVGSVSAGSNPEPQISNFKTEQANPEHQTPNLKPQQGRGERHARNSKYETKQLKQKRALKELKRSFEERIKAGNLLDREMIMDFVRSAARTSEIPLPGFPPPP